MQPICLHFDLPISVNKMYRRTRFTVVLSNDAMAWKTYAQAWAYRQYPYNEPLKGLIAATYRFYGSKADFDNNLKLTNDAMNGVIYADDSQIVEAHIYVVNRHDKKPRMEVEIVLIGEDV